MAIIMRFVIPAAAVLLLSGFTQAELEKAKNTKEFYKDGYWKCLATEIVRVVPTNMSAQEFSLFVKRACSKERNDFFNSLSNYIVMLHPTDRSRCICACQCRSASHVGYRLPVSARPRWLSQARGKSLHKVCMRCTVLRHLDNGAVHVHLGTEVKVRPSRTDNSTLPLV